MAATILSKSVVREDHPLYLGVYEGAMGRQEVTDYIAVSYTHLDVYKRQM